MTDSPPQLRFAWKPFLVQSQIVALLTLAQFQLNSWTTRVPSPGTADRVILFALFFAGLNLATMLAGDRLARRRGWWRRWQYLAIGAVAASVPHHVALAPGAHVAAARDGILFFLFLVPVTVGSVTAFLLHRSLGYADAGDDPHALAQAEAGAADNAALRDIGTAAYYDGPLQVRTSAMAAFIAALAGSALYVFTILLGISQSPWGADTMPPLMRGNPILGALYGVLGISALFYVAVMRTHGFLARRHKTELRAYALGGLVVPGGFALVLTTMMGPFGIFMALPWILPSAVAMTTYHRIAGFEPLDLPDDIEVRDPRTLLAADHVRRRVRRVVPVG